MGSHYLTNIFTALFSRARVSNLFRLILKEKKYSVRTFHTYLARCSLSIDSEAFVFFFPGKIFFSDFLFWIFSIRFEKTGSCWKLWLPHRSWNLRRLSGLRLRACASACVCVRPSPCARLLAPITFGS